MKKQIRIQRRDAPVEFESAFYHIIGWSVLCLEKVDAGISSSFNYIFRPEGRLYFTDMSLS